MAKYKYLSLGDKEEIDKDTKLWLDSKLHRAVVRKKQTSESWFEQNKNKSVSEFFDHNFMKAAFRRRRRAGIF